MMDYSKIDAVIRELLAVHAGEKAPPEQFREGIQALGPEGGRLVETVVRMVRPRLGLEIGTSSGFSALCALRGALDGGFRLITVDHDRAKIEWARENFVRAGVQDRVEIVVDDALAAAEKLAGPFDYVLLDADKEQNLPLIKTLLPKLNPGAVVLTDNALTHQVQMRGFFEFVQSHHELASATYHTGHGIEVTVKLVPRITERVSPRDT